MHFRGSFFYPHEADVFYPISWLEVHEMHHPKLGDVFVIAHLSGDPDVVKARGFLSRLSRPGTGLRPATLPSQAFLVNRSPNERQDGPTDMTSTLYFESAQSALEELLAREARKLTMHRNPDPQNWVDHSMYDIGDHCIRRIRHYADLIEAGQLPQVKVPEVLSIAADMYLRTLIREGTNDPRERDEVIAKVTLRANLLCDLARPPQYQFG